MLKSRNFEASKPRNNEKKNEISKMESKDFAFGRMNYILLAVGMAVVIIDFLLMSGSGSSDTTYDPDIFSARRIKVAPVVCLLGFVSMIYAVVHRPKGDNQDTVEQDKEVRA